MIGKNKHYEEISDESEIFKRKSLSSIKMRKKARKITTILLILLSALIIAACIYAYFFDEI